MKIAMVKMLLSDYMDVVNDKNKFREEVSELQQTLREVEETAYARHISNAEKIELLDGVVRDYEKYKLALKVCVGWMENTPFYFFKGNEIPDSADMSAERDKRAHYEVLKQAKEALGMIPKQDR